MARPIKETPILSGNDAKKFLKDINTPKDSTMVRKERERIIRNYELLKGAEVRDRHIPA